jgi:amidase
MAPIALGTETEGSLISPATRQGLWTIKPTLGTVPNSGIMPVSVYFDTAGPFCKTVQDTVDLLSTLTPSNKPHSSESDLYQAIKGIAGWKDLRIGTVSPERYKYDETIQVPADDATAQIVNTLCLEHLPNPECYQDLRMLTSVAESSYRRQIRKHQEDGCRVPPRCRPTLE